MTLLGCAEKHDLTRMLRKKMALIVRKDSALFNLELILPLTILK